ncbi:hypothetical protein AVEN_195820-1 [Araneus ventricosus]|uniref:Reverse transcriptase zinc-binding domain-containing protein n=1 Tax=Araneus ventricosus TaxID=182803 RepID=A0A4Y2SA02_ARAVE|nr:hypothetical protein AVEN_195820-1 [Araneus ventricosus]
MTRQFKGHSPQSFDTAHIPKFLTHPDTHAIFKEIKSPRCISNTYVTQLVKTHGLCPHYLKRFNLKNCNCRCGENTQDDIRHYIFTCPLTGNLRKLIRHDTPISQVLADKRLTAEVIYILRELYQRQQDFL